MNKLPKRRFHLVFSLLMGAMMIFLMTFVITMVNVGPVPRFPFPLGACVPDRLRRRRAGHLFPRTHRAQADGEDRRDAVIRCDCACGQWDR